MLNLFLLFFWWRVNDFFLSVPNVPSLEIQTSPLHKYQTPYIFFFSCLSLAHVSKHTAQTFMSYLQRWTLSDRYRWMIIQVLYQNMLMYDVLKVDIHIGINVNKYQVLVSFFERWSAIKVVKTLMACFLVFPRWLVKKSYLLFVWNSSL